MKIHHIGYLVKKLDRAVEAFETLGFQLKQKKIYDEHRKIHIVFVEKDGYVIELVSPVGKDSVVSGLITQYRNMPYHLCYSSNEFEKDLKYLSQQGCVQIDEPCIAPALGNGRVVFLMSPVIGMIELYEKNKGGVILCEIAVYNIINTMFKYIQSTSTHKCIGKR